MLCVHRRNSECHGICRLCLWLRHPFLCIHGRNFLVGQPDFFLRGTLPKNLKYTIWVRGKALKNENRISTSSKRIIWRIAIYLHVSLCGKLIPQHILHISKFILGINKIPRCLCCSKVLMDFTEATLHADSSFTIHFSQYVVRYRFVIFYADIFGSEILSCKL